MFNSSLSTTLKSARAPLGAGLLTLFAVGCAPEDEAQDEPLFSVGCTGDLDAGRDTAGDSSTLPSDAGETGLDAALPTTPEEIAPPKGEPVLANGPGCPAGTWTATLSADGMSAEVAFTGYEAATPSGVSSKACVITVPTPSLPNRAYTVTEVATIGTVSVEAGMLSRWWTRFWVEGEYTLGTGLREEFIIEGPSEQAYAHVGPSISYNPWTPCGVDRDLLLEERVTIRSAPESTAALTAKTSTAWVSKIAIRLAARDCVPTPEAPAKPVVEE